MSAPVNLDEILAWLCSLRDTADAECQAIVKEHPAELRGEAINWGDLGCTDAEYCVYSEGRATYRVWISEASPACAKLSALLSARLAARGFHDVEVLMEW